MPKSLETTRPMIYLNNAATSFPKPREVNEAIVSYLASEPFHAGRESGKE